MPEHPLCQGQFPARLLQPRVLAGSEAHDHRHESQRERGTRYGAIVAYLSQHGAAGTQEERSRAGVGEHRVAAHAAPRRSGLGPGARGEAEAEMDEMWSFVRHKGHPRWLWHAIDHHTGKVLASVFGCRKDEVFLQLKALLEPFGLTRYSTDYWGAYTRHLDPDVHSPGKRNTQKIERKHLTLRTRIKRLVRKTICFSKTTQMHDIVLGLFVNRYAFGRAV